MRAKGRVEFGAAVTVPPANAGIGASGKVNLDPTRGSGLQPILASDLYVDLDALSPILSRGIILLRSALRCASDGVGALAAGDPIKADLQLQSLRPMLRKLFMCREIGDGFAAVVDALISSLQNNHGMPLLEPRFDAVQKALLQLRDQPFLSFAAAVNIIEDLERVGFSTEPPGFEHLADWLLA